MISLIIRIITSLNVVLKSGSFSNKRFISFTEETLNFLVMRKWIFVQSYFTNFKSSCGAILLFLLPSWSWISYFGFSLPIAYNHHISEISFFVLQIFLNSEIIMSNIIKFSSVFVKLHHFRLKICIFETRNISKKTENTQSRDLSHYHMGTVISHTDIWGLLYNIYAKLNKMDVRI